jgi:bacterioferritin-associated ferredoxin
MTLSKDQTKSLLDFVASSKPDELDCDSCFDHMAEFVENELAGQEIPVALQKVQRHLDQCACCNDEHNALIEGLKALKP